MELSNEFTVSLPPEEAFAVLTDVTRIAPCLPGAELQEVRGEEYLGVVKVKVGPITAQYKGVARFLELDATARTAVLRAEGRDTRGQGNANATVTARLEPHGSGTKVAVRTDLTVTGKVAQFGRGVLADVSAKLLGQFVDCLEATIAAGGAPAEGAPSSDAPGGAKDAAKADEPAAAAPAPTASSGQDRAGAGPAGQGEVLAARAAEPVDLVSLAGSSLLKRAAPVAAAVLGLAGLLAAVRALLRRGRGGAAGRRSRSAQQPGAVRR